MPHVGKSPPCADAIMAAGIARVVSAIEIQPRGGRQAMPTSRRRPSQSIIGLGRSEAAHDHAGTSGASADQRPM